MVDSSFRTVFNGREVDVINHFETFEENETISFDIVNENDLPVQNLRIGSQDSSVFGYVNASLRMTFVFLSHQNLFLNIIIQVVERWVTICLRQAFLERLNHHP